jgi:hypothetical protein
MPEQDVKAGELNKAKEVFDVMTQQSKRVHPCGCSKTLWRVFLAKGFDL